MVFRFGEREDALALSKTIEGIGKEQIPLLLQDLAYHCLIPLAHLALRDLQSAVPSLLIPPSLSSECAVGFHRDLVRATIIEHHLRVLLQRFAEKGLQAMPLKGNYLGPRIYSKGEARPYRDIDLMFKAEELDEAVRVLEEEGFRPLWGAAEFIPPPHPTCYRRVLEGGSLKVDVDLHVSIHWPKEYERRTRLNSEDFWACSRVEEMWGMPVAAMSPEHLVIFICLDLAVNHRFARLLSLRDLFEVFSAVSVDLDELVRWCRRWEVLSFVYPALRLLAELNPRIAMAREILDELRPRYPLSRAFEMILVPSRLPSMRSRSLTPRNLLFFLLADRPIQRAAGLHRIPGHLYNRIRHP